MEFRNKYLFYKSVMFMYSCNIYSQMKTAVALDSFIFADIKEV